MDTRVDYVIYCLFTILFVLAHLTGSGQTIMASSDGYVCLGGSDINLNHGRDETLQTCYSFNRKYNLRSYIRFHLDGSSSYYSSVRLRLFGNADSFKIVEVYSASGDWDEDSLSGLPGKKPSLSTYLGEFTMNQSYDYKDIDITDYVNFLVSKKTGNITIALVDREHQGGRVKARFHSRENNSGNGPSLQLVKAAGLFEGFIPRTYYLDDKNGNDDNNGVSPSTAWKTLERAGRVFYKGGDRLLFKRGGHFTGSLFIKYLPVNTEIFMISSYGEGDIPQLDGQGKEICVLKLFNTPYVELKNLDITQSSNVIPVIRRGIYYQGEDIGAIKHVKFDSLVLKNILGNPGKDDRDLLAKSNAGLFTEITGNNIPTYFDGYYLEDCYFYRIGRHEAVNQSSWQTRSLTANINWTPSKNVFIRRNVFEETASDGLIVRVATRPVIEHNLFRRCSLTLSGNASFSYNCDSALWQFNEACYTVYNTGDHDGAGFDSDYKSKYTIFQYNYAHDNEYGDMLITGGPASSKGFNDSTIVRYNVFYNNGHHGIRISGLATNTFIRDNVIYNDEYTVSPTDPYDEYPGYRIFYHKNWGGWPQNTTYKNNIYYFTLNNNAIIELHEDLSKGTIFESNTIYGKNIRDYPPDNKLSKEDPHLYFPPPSSVH